MEKISKNILLIEHSHSFNSIYIFGIFICVKPLSSFQSWTKVTVGYLDINHSDCMSYFPDRLLLMMLRYSNIRLEWLQIYSIAMISWSEIIFMLHQYFLVAKHDSYLSQELRAGSCRKTPEINGTWRQFSDRKVFWFSPVTSG